MLQINYINHVAKNVILERNKKPYLLTHLLEYEKVNETTYIQIEIEEISYSVLQRKM